MNIGIAILVALGLLMTGCAEDKPDPNKSTELDYGFGMGMLYQQALDAPEPLQCPMFDRAEAFALAYQASHVNVPAVAARQRSLQPLRDKCRTKEAK